VRDKKICVTLINKPQDMRPLGRSISAWEYNITMHIKNAGGRAWNGFG
jgi:hypothetical protein